MRRRDFGKAIASMAIWPLAAHAQHADRMRKVSMLLGLAENDPETVARLKAFRLGMRDLAIWDGSKGATFRSTIDLPGLTWSRQIGM